MRKLSLTNLTQAEIKKNEAQQVRAGLACLCPCICSCSCPPDYRIFLNKEDRLENKNWDLNWFLVN